MLAGIFDSTGSRSRASPSSGYVVGFLFYVVQYFVIFFCNTALVGAALIRLRGGDPTVADGFRIAGVAHRRHPRLRVIAATVGMILRAISERSGFIGKLVVGLVGLAWNLATFLVVPVLVVETSGRSRRSSAAPLPAEDLGRADRRQRRDGRRVRPARLRDAAAGRGPARRCGRDRVGRADGHGRGLVVLALVAIALIGSALGGVYAAAVYRYAAEGQSARSSRRRWCNAFRAK